jgi:hypothetical protein
MKYIMKIKLSIVCVLTMMAATIVVSPTFASTYRGGGYSVKIGDDGSYYGCDAKKRCLFINEYSHRQSGAYTWENKGFTYIMSPMQGKYLLKVINPQDKVILQRSVK